LISELLIDVGKDLVDLIKLVLGIAPLTWTPNRKQNVLGPAATTKLVDVPHQGLSLIVCVEALQRPVSDEGLLVEEGASVILHRTN